MKVPFDIWLGNGRVISGCEYVDSDEESFTVDFDLMESFGRTVRTRGQFRMDMLIHIAHRTPLPGLGGESMSYDDRAGGFVGT
jgi:hypothetical protein